MLCGRALLFSAFPGRRCGATSSDCYRPAGEPPGKNKDNYRTEPGSCYATRIRSLAGSSLSLSPPRHCLAHSSVESPDSFILMNRTGSSRQSAWLLLDSIRSLRAHRTRGHTGPGCLRGARRAFPLLAVASCASAEKHGVFLLPHLQMGGG